MCYLAARPAHPHGMRPSPRPSGLFNPWHALCGLLSLNLEQRRFIMQTDIEKLIAADRRPRLIAGTVGLIAVAVFVLFIGYIISSGFVT